MPLVWLVARATGERQRSFQGKLDLDRIESRVRAGYLWPSTVRLGVADRDERPIRHVVCGIAQIEAGFAYDDADLLTEAQRRQYQVWRQVAPGYTLPGHLHFYHVVSSYKLQHVAPDDSLYDHRHVVKTWNPVDDAAHGLFESLSGIPSWCCNCPERALYLPYDWASRVACGSWQWLSVLADWPSSKRYGWSSAVFGCGSGADSVSPLRVLAPADYEAAAAVAQTALVT